MALYNRVRISMSVANLNVDEVIGMNGGFHEACRISGAYGPKGYGIDPEEEFTISTRGYARGWMTIGPKGLNRIGSDTAPRRRFSYLNTRFDECDEGKPSCGDIIMVEGGDMFQFYLVVGTTKYGSVVVTKI